jgi:hypothetical protein
MHSPYNIKYGEMFLIYVNTGGTLRTGCLIMSLVELDIKVANSNNNKLGVSGSSLCTIPLG